MRCIFRHFAAGAALLALPMSAGAQQLPADVAAPGEKAVITLHAQGAQIYECAATKDGKFAWSFREPIATLLLKGKTVGRHYAGPSWEYMDGSVVVAKVAGRAPGKSPKDIPWLKLTATSHRGQGMFAGVTTVQRINTEGGQLEGACSAAGSFNSVPYAADYVFLRK
jgi:outer membrane protein assembly factor BamB